MCPRPMELATALLCWPADLPLPAAARALHALQGTSGCHRLAGTEVPAGATAGPSAAPEATDSGRGAAPHSLGTQSDL